MFKKITLNNRLRIITVPLPETQAVTVLVLVGTGSKYEKKETSGISHFLEHLFFKGTQKRPDTLAIAETLDKVGGIYNAFTAEEATGYFAKVDTAHFDLALDWVSDIFLNSKLDPKEIEREKCVIIEEINMYYDHPSSYVGILWGELLYGEQPAGWNVAGDKESVSKINRQKLLNYMRAQYVASNTIICLAGKIPDPSKAIEKIKKYFSHIGTLNFCQKPAVIEKQKKPNLLLHHRLTDQTHIYLGVRAYNLFHPQRYAQEILGIILGGMMSSRLFIEVREKLGLAYYIHATLFDDTDTGYLVTQAGIDNSKVDLAISTILKEYKKISRTKISPSELKKAKDYIKGKTTLLLESSDAQASFYAGRELLENKILTPKELFKKIDQVSTNDILKVAKDIFQPQKLNLALIGPFKDRLKFEKILKI